MFQQQIVKIFLPLFLISIFSCRNLVQSEFDDIETIPSVNSILVADSLIKVHVSLTGKLGKEPLPVVENAEILLSENGVFIERILYTTKGIYVSSIIAKAGSTYDCVVNIPGYKTITCRAIIPSIPEIVSTEINLNTWSDEEGYLGHTLTLTFTNKPQEKQYFQLCYPGLENKFIYEMEFGEIPSSSSALQDEFMNDFLNINDNNYDVLINEKYFYSTPSGGTLGKITDPVLLSEGLPLTIFSNENIEGNSYSMTIHFMADLMQPETAHNDSIFFQYHAFGVELRAINYEYYQYTRQRYLYNQSKVPDISMSSSTRFALYSNVQNGYGIFAGYSSVIAKKLFIGYNDDGKLYEQTKFVIK